MQPNTYALSISLQNTKLLNRAIIYQSWINENDIKLGNAILYIVYFIKAKPVSLLDRCHHHSRIYVYISSTEFGGH